MTISRALARPLSRPLKRNLYSSAAAAFTPTALFANGEQGAWYDPSDLTSLFQTNAGSLNAVVGSTVGLALDKRLMGGKTAAAFIAAQPELVVNGGFDSGITGWTAFDQASGLEDATRLTNSGGAGVIDATVGNTVAQQAITTVIGQRYRFYINATSVGAGNRYWLDVSNTTFVNGANLIGPISSVGAQTVWFTATATTTYIHVHADNLGTPTMAFDNISVKEIPGNHGTQATAASRPILQVDGNGKHYLAFDGVDDFLVTSAIDFSATDEMSVFAGVRKLSDATPAPIVELSATAVSNNGSFAMFAPDNLGAAVYSIASRGTALAGKSIATAAPSTNIVTGQVNISGPYMGISVDGGVPATNVSTQGTGNFGATYPLYIGRRGGTTLPFNGRIYSLIVRGLLTADTNLTNTEAYVAGKTGIVL